MAVIIRMARHGRKKRPFYRIVVTDKDMPRDGRYLELIGTMNPLTDPATIEIKEDRVKHWVKQGAKPSDTVSQIIAKTMPGYLEELETKRTEKRTFGNVRNQTIGLIDKACTHYFLHFSVINSLLKIM